MKMNGGAPTCGVGLCYIFFYEHTNLSSKLKKIGKTQLVQKLEERKQSFELKWVDAFTH